MPEPARAAHGDARVTVVVRTRGDAAARQRCLDRLAALPERPPVVVVDAAACNDGVAGVRTPFVAFCDDDAWWAPGALGRAAVVLQAHASLGAVVARVLCGPQNRLDARCAKWAASPLPRGRGPGPALIDCGAGAVVMRTAAFRQAGGCDTRLGDAAGSLLGIDLVSAGWRIAYVAEVVQHRDATASENDDRGGQRLGDRLCIAWLRLVPSLAWHTTRTLLHEARARGVLGQTLARALRRAPWVLRARRVAPPEVQAWYARVHGGPAPRRVPRWTPGSQSAR